MGLAFAGINVFVFVCVWVVHQEHDLSKKKYSSDDSVMYYKYMLVLCKKYVCIIEIPKLDDATMTSARAPKIDTTRVTRKYKDMVWISCCARSLCLCSCYVSLSGVKDIRCSSVCVFVYVYVCD